MAGEEEAFETCNECGATVYPEHLQQRVADRFEGRLLCPHCLRDRRTLPPGTDPGAGPAAAPAVSAASPAGVAEAINLIEITSTGVAAGDSAIEPAIEYDKKPSVVRTYSGAPVGSREGLGLPQHHYRREPLTNSAAATRCRVFHCKLADGAFGHMMDQINDWADADDTIEIKFASSCIGVVEGKHNDPHLIVTVFY